MLGVTMDLHIKEEKISVTYSRENLKDVRYDVPIQNEEEYIQLLKYWIKCILNH